ncbi:helix-turn-helix transcriptional regulator [uncultured Bacteroides sp.]|uniref:helix-turn-helix domain-containing protein n=1 Tax=uncultured Bacteroides sp. TaxID=162156 RepID=UPI002AAAA3FD|nr:helix-turn-helix transcriptional regulator [uncultured Bacteroides sp.]
MESTLNTELLSSMLKDKRGKKGLRTVAEEIGGVSYATLSRIEQGRIPDVDTFVKICKWLEVSTDTFIVDAENLGTVSTKDVVIAHLRSEKTLSKETVDMLIKMVDIAYNTK